MSKRNQNCLGNGNTVQRNATQNLGMAVVVLAETLCRFVFVERFEMVNKSFGLLLDLVIYKG